MTHENPKSTHYEAGQTASGNMDLDQFTDKIMELTSLAWGQDWGTFTLEEPMGNESTQTNTPIITYDTHERVRSASHKSLDPVLYDTVRDPEDPSAVVKLYRMWFDVEMEFKIYHESNREARILMDEFETFLFTYKGYFKDLGISDIIFLAEPKPEVVTLWQQELAKRTLRYLVRIERITTIRSNALQKASPVRIENGEPQQDPLFNGDTLMSHYQGQHRIRD